MTAPGRPLRRSVTALLGAGLATALLAACGSAHPETAANGAARTGTSGNGSPKGTSSSASSGTAAVKPSTGKIGGSSKRTGHKSASKHPATRHRSTHISASGMHMNQTVVLRRLPGSTKPVCQRVGNRHDVRSGSMAAGPFDTARHSYGNGPVRLYWIPQQTGDLSGVSVTATNLRTGTVVHYQHTIVSSADPWQYYDTLIPLHPRGTWRLQARSGTATGCFVVKLG